MDNFQQTIINKLLILDPIRIDITDESEKPKGHAGYRAGGNSHLKLFIISDRFHGLTNIQRHKLVYDTLKQELDTQIHALSIKAMTKNEMLEKNNSLV